MIATQPFRVVRERRQLTGVAVIQLGALSVIDDRPFLVDEQTIDQAIRLGNASPNGVKARWGHPGPLSDGLGTYVGRFRNFRRSADGRSALADLQLADAAFRGGVDSLGQHVLDLASEDPLAFGVSISPLLDLDAMRAAGKIGGRSPIRFKAITAIDFVDEPAANHTGLFGDLSARPRQRTFQTQGGAMSFLTDPLGYGLGGEEVESVAAALGEYRADHAALRREGISLLDYVASALADRHGVGEGSRKISDRLRQELVNRQSEFGPAANQGNPLAFVP